MPIIKNVKQLAAEIYAYEPTEDSMSHRIYKDTDCGAWLAFVSAPRFTLRFPWPQHWTCWPRWIVRPLEVLHLVWFLDRLLFVWRKPIGKRVVGVALGSIVEGSDVYIGPYELFFPFALQQFWDALKEIESEADYEWRMANGPRCLYCDEPLDTDSVYCDAECRACDRQDTDELEWDSDIREAAELPYVDD